jgi:creatinine amidohydrolase
MNEKDRISQDALFTHSRELPLWPDGVIERRLEFLRPRQIVALRNECPVIYLPVGALEWHERHMPVGTDGMTAHGISLRAAAVTGGVVYPPLFWGVDDFGVSESGEIRSGMDIPADMPLPGNIFRIGHDTYGQLITEAVAEVFRAGYRVVALVTGHGAKGQTHTIYKVARARNNAAGYRAVVPMEAYAPAMGILPDGGGHAGRSETALILGLHPELVDFRESPPSGEPVLGGSDARAHPVHGPLTVADGNRLVQAAVDGLVARVRDAIDKMPPA